MLPLRSGSSKSGTGWLIFIAGCGCKEANLDIIFSMSIIKEFLRKIHALSEKYKFWLDLAFLMFCVGYVLYGLPLVPFHGDESAYLILSEDYDKVFKNHEVEKILFDPDGKSKQYLRLSTGGILSFSIGFARDITGNDDPINKWLWGSSWEDNVAMGNMPVPQLLNLARFCSAIMGGLAVVLFFLLAQNLCSSRFAAWTAVLAFVTQGSILVNIRRAMQEGPKFLFLILTIYIASYVLKDLKQMRVRRIPYFALGVASGLTLAAKQDAAPMLVAVYLSLVFISIWKNRSLQANLVNILYLGAAAILAYASFLAFMPVFWRWWESVFVLVGIAILFLQMPVLRNDFIAKLFACIGGGLVLGMTIISPALWAQLPIPIVSMLELRESIVGGQISVSTDLNLFEPDSTKNRLPFVVENTVSSDVMYMETASFDVPPVHEHIRAYESSFLSGRTGSWMWDGLILILVLLGIWALIEKFDPENLFTLSLLLITGVLLYFIISLSWQRYFLILQIPYVLLAGIGGRQVWAWIKRFTAQKETALG